MQLLVDSMAAEDLQLMSRWIIKQRRAVLDPFIEVTLSGSTALHNLNIYAVGSLLANQANPFQLYMLVRQHELQLERPCICHDS